jgi:hypothetical protein
VTRLDERDQALASSAAADIDALVDAARAKKLYDDENALILGRLDAAPYARLLQRLEEDGITGIKGKLDDIRRDARKGAGEDFI